MTDPNNEGKTRSGNALIVVGVVCIILVIGALIYGAELQPDPVVNTVAITTVLLSFVGIAIGVSVKGGE